MIIVLTQLQRDTTKTTLWQKPSQNRLPAGTSVRTVLVDQRFGIDTKPPPPKVIIVPKIITKTAFYGICGIGHYSNGRFLVVVVL